MTNNFDFIANLPYVFFAFGFLVVFILFLWGGFISLMAKGQPDRVEKAQKILWTAFISFFAVLLIILVFYLVTFFLKKGEVFKPPAELSGEFPPPSHLENFPPPPQFLNIGNYYFKGPRPLKGNNIIRKAVIYAVLCKKSEKYDIMYIDRTKREDLLKHKKYRCWLENCDKNLKNLYLAVFYTPSENYSFEEKEQIKKELKKQLNPPCVQMQE